VVVASRAAVFPLPLAGAYGASKRAQVAWADALRLELAPDVSVTTVYPSKVASPIHDSTAQAGLSLDGVSRFEPLDGVVDAIVAASLVRTPVRDVATSGRGTVEFLLARHLPSLVDVIVRRTVTARLDAGDFDGAPLAAGLVARRRSRGPHPQSESTRRRITRS
jgi:NAD(P)-dependent dehydrogenase (short-subunit alcohol dehydrogenase family)